MNKVDPQDLEPGTTYYLEYKLSRYQEKDPNSSYKLIGKFDRHENTEESYVKNYGNPLSAIRLYRGTAVVVKKEDKITIKYFEYLRHRSCGVSYFKLSTSVKFFTYNFKKHLMYIGEIKNYNE